MEGCTRLRPRTPSQRRVLEGLRRLPLGGEVASYLGGRGLLEAAERFGLGSVPASPTPRLRPYAGRLVIPSIGPDDNVYDVAFRCILPHDCKESGCPKYLFLPGMDKRLYNLRALTESTGVIDITEGQLDAVTLELCGLHAVAVPGVMAWKKYHHRLFQGFEQVRVWGDGDAAGRAFAQKVSNDVTSSHVMMVVSTPGKDINQVFVEDGRDAVLAIAEGEADDDGVDDGWFDQPEPDWPYDSERPGF